RVIKGLEPNTEYKFTVNGRHKRKNRYPHRVDKIKVTTLATNPGGGNLVVGDGTLWPVDVGSDCITMGWKEPDPKYHRALLCYSRARTPLTFWTRCVDVLGSTSRQVCAEIQSARLYKFRLWGHYLAQPDPTKSPESKRDRLGVKRVATQGAGKATGPEPKDSSCRWTSWLNRDLPSGSGDFETFADFLKAREVCASPRGIECRAREGQPTTGQDQPYTCDPEIGGVCRNGDLAPGDRCLDYEVRFCC
ncbi:MAG: hypothetical protein ACLF0P_08835, partial [Thermoanaerobaculia bacterium]